MILDAEEELKNYSTQQKFFNCISAGVYILQDMIILPVFYFNNQEYINIKKMIINM